MRFLASMTLALLCCSTAFAQKELKPAPAPELKTTQDKVSYGIGLNIGRQFKSQGIEVNPEIVAMAIASVLAGDEPALTPAEIQQAFQAMQQEALKKNSEGAQKFLAANAKKKGVQTTKTGLQYLVIKKGTGKTPTTDDTVQAHYRGKLLSGKVFDESYKGESPTADEKPAEFPVTRVIPGWTEALQFMKVGAQYRLFIPPELAYGENGPPSIGPNALLIFDIHLVGIK